jgi:hypothetical protein
MVHVSVEGTTKKCIIGVDIGIGESSALNVTDLLPYIWMNRYKIRHSRFRCVEVALILHSDEIGELHNQGGSKSEFQ